MMISAVIPIYNRAYCVGRAITSVLEQTHPVDEIIIVNDGSTDNFHEAIEPFASEVRVIHHSENRGAAAARNRAILEAQGDYIAFLDSDDMWVKEKISTQMDFMGDLGVEVSCTNFELVSDNSAEETCNVAWRPYNKVLSLRDVTWGCYVSPGSTLLCKTSLLKEISAYDVSFPRFEDWDLLMRIASTTKCGIGFLPVPLSRVYVRNYVETEQAHEGLKQMLKKHGHQLDQLAAPKGLARQLRSAVAFNKASVMKRQGHYIKMMIYILKSLFLKPANNWPVRVVLLGKILRQ